MGDCPRPDESGPGFVCFPAGEVCCSWPRLEIFDDINLAVSGFYCQDFNADSVCGDDGSFGGIVEPGERFCMSITLDGGIWNSNYDVYVFIDGPLSGLFSSACGPTIIQGTHGFVFHDGGSGGCPPDCPSECPPDCLPPGCPPSCGGPTIQFDPPGSTILAVSSTGSTLVGCAGLVQVTFTSGASAPLPGVRAGSTPCTATSPPCEPYTGQPGVASCVANPAGCCTPLFAPTTSGGGQALCVRSSAVRVDLNNDGFWDVVVPTATLTDPPCP